MNSFSLCCLEVLCLSSIVQENIARDSFFASRFVCFISGIEVHHSISLEFIISVKKSVILMGLVLFSLKAFNVYFCYVLCWHFTYILCQEHFWHVCLEF